MFIGQKNIRNILDNVISSAKTRNESAPHILLNGKPGFGKNTIAYYIAQELNTNFLHFISAKLKVKDICQILIKSKPKDIIFIDEIHALDKKAGEFLYPILEESKVVTEKGSLIIEARTFIGATTNIGEIPKPLLDRFTYHLNLEEYTEDELTELIKLKFANNNISIDVGAVDLLAKSCKGCPRIIHNFSITVRDYCIANKCLATKEVVEKVLKMLDIENGLDKLDRRYLNLLSSVPVSLNVLASNLGVPKEVVSENIEPYLIEQGLIEIKSRGRVKANYESSDFGLEDLFR